MLETFVDLGSIIDSITPESMSGESIHFEGTLEMDEETEDTTSAAYQAVDFVDTTGSDSSEKERNEGEEEQDLESDGSSLSILDITNHWWNRK